ncbi:GDP-mannose 4,6-dehydratase [Meiothermus granaticius]|uniref:GDP-mannose 4,6-dehydratase n=1 Tax=Meiothermus granaticius TaxID=863370 RepID=UPI000E654637|nr:GDP-mannose 4,6-dehydratase [Meiothermus granaticius]
MAKRVFITGITEQDGAYLIKLLLDKGYEVFSAHCCSTSVNLWQLEELGIANQVKPVPFDFQLKITRPASWGFKSTPSFTTRPG